MLLITFSKLICYVYFNIRQFSLISYNLDTVIFFLYIDSFGCSIRPCLRLTFFSHFLSGYVTAPNMSLAVIYNMHFVKVLIVYSGYNEI